MTSHIYIVHSGGASDTALANNLAKDLSGLPSKLVIINGAELVFRTQALTHNRDINATSWATQNIVARIPVIEKAAQILFGTVIVLMSETMIDTAERRGALLVAIGDMPFVEHRRYFICRGTTPQKIKAHYPDLAPIYENITLHLESELPEIIDDVKLNLASRNSSGWKTDGPNFTLWGSTLISIILCIACVVMRFRLLLVSTLAILLYFQSSRTATETLIIGCFYSVGVGFNWIKPLDFWPRLGTRWKWSVSFDSFRLPDVVLLPMGPLCLGGALLGLSLGLITGNKNQAVACLVSGVVLQVVTDTRCAVGSRRRYLAARAAYPTDLPFDETSCSKSQIALGIKCCLINKNWNAWILFGTQLLVFFVAFVGAQHFSQRFVIIGLVALALGLVTPTVMAASWLAATRVTLRYRGLTTMHLQRIGKSYTVSQKSTRPHNSGIDDAKLTPFTEEQRRELMDFTLLMLSPGGKAVQNWLKRPHYAFVSYVWSDEEELRTAEHLDKTLGEIGVPSFRDTREIQDPFISWREHISKALV